MQERKYIQPADPDEYGFGIKAMKSIKICQYCGSTEASVRYNCSKCGKKLPIRSVFQMYQQKHRLCEVCDTVLASYMNHCPHCGTKIK